MAWTRPSFVKIVHVFNLRLHHTNQNVYCAVSRQRPLPRKRFYGSPVSACDATWTTQISLQLYCALSFHAGAQKPKTWLRIWYV